MIRKHLSAVLFVAFAFVTAYAASAQERWAVVETQVNRTNEPLEFYGGGATPGWFTKPRFEGTMRLFTVTSTSFSVHDVDVDHGYQWYDDKASWDTAGLVPVAAPDQTTEIDAEMSSSGSAGIPLNVIGFITNLSGPPQAGDTVGITFTAQADSGTLSYRYYRATGYQTPNYGNWLQARDWGTNNSLAWMPSADDHYIVVAHVTDDPTYTNFHQAGLSIETAGNSANPIQITSFTTNITYPQGSGSTITLSTSAAGGSGQLYYGYYYRKFPDGQWTEIRGYDTVSTEPWTPSEDGWYVVVVHVTDNIAGDTFSTAGMTCTIGQ